MVPEQVTISEQVLFQNLRNESVLLELHQEQYYSLDEIGTLWWMTLAAHNGQTKPIVPVTLDDYDTDEETVLAELDTWLDGLRQRKLIAY